MRNPSYVRSMIVPAALTASCLFGAMLVGVPGIGPRTASANLLGCSNTACSGLDRCVYWEGTACSMPNMNECLTRRC